MNKIKDTASVKREKQTGGKFVRWLTPAVFLLLLFGFTIWNFALPERGFSESENRYLQKLPKFSWESLLDGGFTADFEKYVTDQFPARDRFIGVKTQTEYALGKRDTNGVYFGKDGYLIEKHEDASLNRTQLEKNSERLASFVNRVAGEMGEEHVKVMLVPTAGEILKDKLPSGAQAWSQTELLHRLQEMMPSGSWVDLLTPLLEHQGEAIYYKTDHHWTTLGAYYGYRAWCDSVGTEGMTADAFDLVPVTDSFYGTIYSKARLASTRPDTIHAYLPKAAYQYQLDYNFGEKQSSSLYDESFLDKRDKYSYFLGGNNPLLQIIGPVKNGKRLLLIKDSYAHSIAPFLANEFEQIDLLDLRYFNMSLKQYMEENQFTDVLVLYNAVTFSDDLGVLKIDR